MVRSIFERADRVIRKRARIPTSKMSSHTKITMKIFCKCLFLVKQHMQEYRQPMNQITNSAIEEPKINSKLLDSELSTLPYLATSVVGYVS